MSGNLSKASQTALRNARGSYHEKALSTYRSLDSKRVFLQNLGIVKYYNRNPDSELGGGGPELPSPPFHEDEEPEDPEDEETEEDEGKELAKNVGSVVLKTALISAAVIGGTALALPLIGFGALGPIAGSLAASYQSVFLGGTIASGSIFATLQSIGMVGLSAAAKIGIVSGSAAVSVATTAASKAKKKKEKENSKKKLR